MRPTRETRSDEPFGGPSKSQLKREMTELQGLGVQLLALKERELGTLSLPERLLDALELARRIRSHEGRRRQLQLIGKLMRDVDPEPIRALLADLGGKQRGEALRHHAVESWRDKLIENDEALQQFAAQHPLSDPLALARLIREARDERAAQRPPRAARELFRRLREILT